MVKLNIVHVITGLDLGGAEMMLFKLLKGANREMFEPRVLVMMEKSVLGEQIEAIGISVYSSGVPRGQVRFTPFCNYLKLTRQLKPDLIQAWTYHSNFLASILGLFSPGVPVLWNIRHTPYRLSNYKLLTYFLIRYGKWFSWQPNRIIYNSHVSARRHQALGYPVGKTQVVPNGFDTKHYCPSESAYISLRKELNLPLDAAVIGMVARYHPMKDHANFLRAAGKLHETNPDIHFVLIGRDVDDNNQELVTQISQLRLIGNIHLLGERSNIAELTAGFDIACLTSAWGDAFPNVIGEAMSCAVPCVVTDVGDSAYIVGDAGVVVQPQNPDDITKAWKHLLEMGAEGRRRLGQRARQRILENFSIQKIVEQYEAIYLEEVKN